MICPEAVIYFWELSLFGGEFDQAMAAPGEDWTTFFQKTPKPTTYEETLATLEDFVSIKKQEQNKIVLVSVGTSIVKFSTER